jgi:hypothetical protein
LIGAIAGLALLVTLALCCCLCCRYCWFVNIVYILSCNLLFLCSPLGGRGALYDCKGPFEYYYIERCTDPKCHWAEMPNSGGFFSAPRKIRHCYDALNESTSSSNNTRKESANIITGTTPCSPYDDHDANVVDFLSDNFLSVHTRRKSTAGISITRVKLADRDDSALNSGMKPSNRRPDDETNDLHTVQLPTSANVKVSRITSTAKPRAHSFDDEQTENDKEEPVEKTRKRRKSIEASSVVRVTRVLPKPSTVTRQPSVRLPRQSIVDNTIRLDTVDETAESLRVSPKLDKNKVRIKHVPSARRQMTTNEPHPSQIDTIDLSLTAVEHRQTSAESTIRVERIQTGKKKIKNATVSFQPIVEEVKVKKKPREACIPSSVIVERIPRQNTAKPITYV